MNKWVKVRRMVLSAVLLFLGGGAVAMTAAPADAVAICGQQRICFHQFGSSTGSMSDRTAELLHHFDPAHLRDGALMDFRNYGYFNPMAGSLNDSVTTITNNSDHCLVLWGNVNLKTGASHGDEELILAPHTVVSLWGALQFLDNKLSSAETWVNWSPACKGRNWGTWQVV